MKSAIIVIAFLLAGIFFAGSAFADPLIQVSSSVNPTPLAPGSDGYVQLTFTNTGTSSATNIQVSGASSGPYITISNSGLINLGAVGNGQSTTSLFKFTVSSSAPSGLYPITFSASYCSSTGGCTQINPTAIATVQSPSALQITSIQPSTLAAGQTTTLNFNLINAGSDSINNVVMIWQTPNNEILPLGISNRQFIASIGAGSSLTIPVNVSVSSSISPGVLPLSIVLTYHDKSGMLQNVTSSIGIQIGGATEFDVGLQQYSAGTASLSIANIGVNPASSVSISIPQQNNFAVTGANSVFLGNLNSGDFSIANFAITSTRFSRNASATGASNILTVQISYSDTSGARQLVQKEVTLDIATAESNSTARNQGLFGMSSIIWIVAIVIVIAGALLWYFKFRKKKNFLSDFLAKRFKKS